MRRDTSRHGRQLWEEQHFVINHPAMFKTLFLGLFFAVESKSGIKMLLNLLLLDIIGPKNATLFIRDQLQGGHCLPAHSTPPPQKLILLSIFLNDIQLNSKLCILKHCIHLMFTFSSGWILSALCGALNSIQANKVQQYGRGWTKLQFLGPIISKSKRFTSFLMPDLDSTAKINPKINSLNLVGVLSLNFWPRVAMHFKVGADPVTP